VSARGERIAHVLLGLTLLVEAGALWPPAFRLTDHLIFWNVGRLLAAGRSPYDGAAWAEVAARYDNVNIRLIVDHGGTLWPYPPWTGYLFVPFGALPADVGLPALHAAYLVVGLAAAVAFARSLRWTTWSAYALALVIVPAFQPFIYAERLGHFDSFLLAGVALVAYGLRRDATAPFVVGALLLATKPQIVLVFAGVVLALLLRRRRLLGASVAALAMLSVATFARHPEAVAAMLAGSRDRLTLLFTASANPVPNVWGLAALVAGEGWPIVGAALAAACAAFCLIAVRRAVGRPRMTVALAAGLVLSLALAPYVFSYDHLLLLPAVQLSLLAADSMPGRTRQVHLIVTIAAVALFPWLTFFLGVATGDHRSSALTVILLAPVLAAGASALRDRTPPSP